MQHRAALLAALTLATATFGPRAAHGDGPLEVVPVEGGSWAEQIARLQAAPHAPGTRFHVWVADASTRQALACGTYALQLDARGERGLHVGECDPTTSATEIVLLDRRALFAAGDPVPVPVPVSVTATALQQTVTSGGAGIAAGVEFRCVGAVRPYVSDLLNGTYVYLTPERFGLEPLESGVHASLSGEGWIISATRRDAVATASFRIVDLRDGHEVTRSRVAMDCRTGSASGPMLDDVAESDPPIHLPVGAVGRGSTRGAVLHRLACTSGPAPTMVWRYTAPAEGAYEFLLQGGYDTALEVRRAEQPADSLGCSDDDVVATHSRVVLHLRRGESYDLFVSGQSGDAGRYEVAVLPIAGDVEVSNDNEARTVEEAP